MYEKIRIERALGSHEEMYWRLDAGQPLNFSVRATLSGPVTPKLTRGALDALQKRHPKLRVKIVAKCGKPYFRYTEEPIPLQVSDGDETTVHSLLEEKTNQLFDTTTGPLLRVSQVLHGANQSSVIFSFHHTISDGRSAIFLLRDFVLYVEKLAEGESLVVESLPMAPAFEELLPDSVKGWRGGLLLLQAMARLAFGFLKSGFVLRGLPTVCRSSLSERKVIVFQKTLPPDVTAKLIELTRNHNTTLHGVLHAAFVLSACQEISPGKFLNLFAGTVTDIRYALPDGVVEATGLFATVAGGPMRASSNDSIWELAFALRERLHSDVKSKMNLVLTALPYRVSTWVMRMVGSRGENLFLKLLNVSHPSTIPLSNVGVVEYPMFGGVFDIEELCVVSSPSILGNLSCHAVTVKGRLNLSVGGSAPTLDPAMASRYLNRAVDILVEESELRTRR